MHWLWSHLRLRSRLFALASLLVTPVVIYILVAVFTHAYVHFVLLPKIHQTSSELDRFEPRILADLKLLTANPVFPELPREKNAERFLSGFISWDGPHVDPLKDLNHDRLVSLMKAHEHAAKNDEEWAALLGDEDLAALDLAWVDQLVAYDHINFETHPAFSDLLSRVEHSHGVRRLEIAGSLPMPRMNELRFAALARVAQLDRLHRKDQLTEASVLYRHVSYLLSTTDSLVGAMNAAVMLQNEKSLGQRTDFDWPLVEEARIEAFRRTSWAWNGIERAKAHEGSLGPYEPFFNRKTSACAGALDVYGMESVLQDYLSPIAFLEPDLEDHLLLQKDFRTRLFNVCEHASMKQFFEKVAEADSPLMLNRRKFNPAHVPFLRRIVGLSLIAETTPMDVRLYEDEPRQPASSAAGR